MTRWTIAAVTWVSVTALPGLLWAQDTTPKVEPSAPTAEAEGGKARRALERWQGRYSDLKRRGVELSLGTVLSGSSLAAGVEVGRDRLFGTSVGASVAGAWSIRAYQQYDLRVGIIKGRSHRTELRPVDTDLPSIFNDNSLLVFGTSVFVHVRQRVYPRIDFFGLGQGATIEGRSDYNLRGASADLVFQWQRDRHLGISGRIGRLGLSLGDPTNGDIPDVQTVYSAAAAPALDAQPRYTAVGAAVTLDFRDQPRVTQSGSFLGLALWRASETNGPGSWMRMAVDGRHFIPLNDGRQVVALRFLVSGRLDHGALPIPFYLQPTIGGSKTLRGFGSYRLRGESVWAANAEYRWRALKRLEVAPFLDLGAVSSGFSTLAAAGVAMSPGLGARVIADTHVIGRFDVARGRDGVRLVATIGASY